MNGQAPNDFDASEATVRPAQEPDHAAIRALFHQSMLNGQLHEGDTGADIEELQEAYFSDEGASGFWVACCGDEVIGMIGVKRTQENIAELRRLRVREDFRRRGVGRRLLEHAIDFCRRHGYLKVILDMRIERASAIAIVEKYGFTLARTRDIDGHKTLDFYLDLYREPQR